MEQVDFYPKYMHIFDMTSIYNSYCEDREDQQVSGKSHYLNKTSRLFSGHVLFPISEAWLKYSIN